MSILDDVKSVASTVQEINNLDLYKRVLDLNKGILDLVEENRELRAENEALKEKLNIQGKMIFSPPPFYYQEGDTTPYCPACWEGNRKAIHVVLANDTGEYIIWTCPACKTIYNIDKSRGTHSPSARPGPWS